MTLGEDNSPLTEAPYTINDMVLREIGGGIWFWLSAALAVAFFAYVIRKVMYERDRPDTVVIAAFFLGLFCTGSAIRAFLSWMQFMYILNGWPYRVWIETWPWFGGSVICNAVGAAGGLWLLTPKEWRTLITFGVFVWSIFFTFFLYYFF